MPLPPPSDDLIVGAGIAGLACARTLADQGLRVCLVEATDRVGGRILTHRHADQVLELGAEFVHGRPPELLALIAEAGLTLAERDGSHLSVSSGHLAAEDSGDEADDEADDRFAPLEQLSSHTGPDRSFADFLAATGLPESQRQPALNYVEGFNAADASLISAASLGLQQAAEDSIEGDHLSHIREGYDRLPQFLADRLLAAGGTLLRNTRVHAVHWGTGRVALETSAGELLATRAVLTLPLGVLKSGTVHIVPEPRHLLDAAALMHMGPVARFTLVFREPFWQTHPPSPDLSRQALEGLSFLFDPGQLPSVWWSTHPERSPSNTAGRTLTGWAGGPRALPLLALPQAELSTLACRSLARIFSLTEHQIQRRLEICLTHNWSSDPNSLGAYSYVGVGSVTASARMSQPVEHTLFFAGEHTDTTGHWGTVHGALRSGLRAARQILNQA